LYKFIIDLGFEKFRTKKLQTAITFDKELGLRRSKNESCSKWGNEFADGPPEIPKFHRLGFLFYFFVIFHLFFCYLLENS